MSLRLPSVRSFITSILVGPALVASLTLGSAGTAWAADCASRFLDGTQPRVSLPAPQGRYVLLCNLDFAVLVSGTTHEPVWVAEHLTRQDVRAARHQVRQGVFHEETRQPPGDRAHLEDYRRSGFDRGHMMPSGDAPTEVSQQQTFSLSNMVPQTPDLNRGLWAGVEKQVRDLAKSEGEIYVVTGPAYRTAHAATIGPDALPVPTSTWKAVYLPARRQAGVYVCKNLTEPRCTQVPVAALIRVTGVDPFPTLPDRIKAGMAQLPEPKAEPYHVSPRLQRLTRRILSRFLKELLSSGSPL
ncbi:DNA/RNA non-specific endonuclease [Swaminathania salitolerans]|uniref:Endonuclease n=1 Tax=Swaminathania salitolerans TaxID=182838 RepID=A0A511BUZ8_9PROT|nr:DNA/RNA non-specific endonuclease [Swaminathania salitolerans]GBQ13413.1 endonuclease [Swaminathania salitolerans LMG 21291]GEL03314.1 hypothetical protein SSA02_24770 [Swaminathania salitolerans]